MKIRWSFAAGLLIAAVLASCVGVERTAFAQAADSGEILNDAVLRSLGIEREWLKNDKLREALTEAIRKLQTGDGNATLEQLKKAAEADLSLPPAELLLARLVIAGNNIPTGRQLLDQVFNKHRDTPEVYLLLGNLALGEGRLTDAYLEYTHAGTLVGALVDGKGSVVEGRWSEERRNDFLREVYSGKAAVYEQLQNWDKADSELNIWLAMKPNDPLVHLRKGRILYLKGVTANPTDDKSFDAPYNDAKKEFQEAYEIQKKEKVYKNDPAMERPEVVLLNLHTLANKLDRARAEIKALGAMETTLKSEDPKEASRIFTQISTWYLRQGEFDEARTFAKKATDLDSESPALKALSAMLSYYANDPKAEEDFAAMHAANPGDFFASNYLALIQGESDDEAKRGRAVQLAELNARLNPQSAEALSTLGWCYFNAQRYQDALRVMGVFTQGAQISPDTAYYFARVLSVANRQAISDVINLLDSAVASKGPFKHRRDAETWREALLGSAPKKPDAKKPAAPPVVPASDKKSDDSAPKPKTE
jgi:tetratricopeptide (TPR) repeat protein